MDPHERRPLWLYAALAVLVVVAGGVTAGVLAERSGGPAGEKGPPAGNAEQELLTTPVALTCPSGMQSSSIFDFMAPGGEDTREEAVEARLEATYAAGEPYVLDADGAWILREDGTAYARLGLQRNGGWQVGAEDRCHDDTVREQMTPLLDCGDQSVVRADIDEWLAFHSPDQLEAASRWVDEGDEVHVHEESRDAATLLLSSDGNTHTALGLPHYDRQGWRVTEVTACADALPGLAEQTEISYLNSIEVGHCWVEPLDYDGEIWAVPTDDQFGWGGGEPAGFRSSGTLERKGRSMVYTDAGGTRLEMWPASDPRTELPGGGICD